jgi:hypothetical protein
LSLQLLIELLLLQLGLHERAVIKIAAAVQVCAKQVEVRADCRLRLVR